MHHLVWILGAFMALWGIMAIFRPDWMKRCVDFMAVGQRFRGAAALKIVVGVIFLIFARECRNPSVIIALGILMAGGSTLFMVALKPETIKAWIAWWQKQALWLYRLWGIVASLLGGFIIYTGIPN
jgi:hypothetical protein